MQDNELPKKEEMFQRLADILNRQREQVESNPARFWAEAWDRVLKIERLLDRVKYYLSGETCLVYNQNPICFRPICIETELMLRQKKAMDIIEIYENDRRKENA